LLKLVEQETRVAEIAKRLGRKKGAIRSRIKKLIECP
jgi:predicted transcriptional regulator